MSNAKILEIPIVSCRKAMVNGGCYYFTGWPCFFGHIDYRNTRTGRCLSCVALQKEIGLREYQHRAIERKLLRATVLRGETGVICRSEQVARATPKWADRAMIKGLYEFAKRLQRTRGIAMAVDHFIPLRHPLVCGLHVHQNLRLSTFAANLEKSNDFGDF